MPVRLAHFSDVHLTAKPLDFLPRDMMSKRFTGWLKVLRQLPYAAYFPAVRRFTGL